LLFNIKKLPLKKFALVVFVIVTSIIIASLFGIIHDQITYSIAPEYYTKFKFIQFGLTEDSTTYIDNIRLLVTIVGIMATWWMGLLIGIVYAFYLLFFQYSKSLYNTYFKTIGITFIVTILCSIIGYLNWKWHAQYYPCDWYLPEDLIDKNSFICVGHIHNFSYLGGELGILIGILYLTVRYQKQKKASN
jgi:hypothetical protein